jgi:hypothetical protein
MRSSSASDESSGHHAYPFIPSGPNFTVALDFFAALGSDKTWHEGGLAGLRFEDRRGREGHMSKVVYWMTVSLDGFVETRDGKIDWTAPDEALPI